MGTRILPSLILVAILVQCGESDPDPDPWLANEPDSECRDQETSVVSNCPNVEVRDAALGPG